MIAGSTRVPTLWYTPTRSVPVSPGRIGEQVRAGGLEPVGDRLDVAEQQAPGLGELHRPPPARPVEQPDPERALEAP